jgi:hypothetical protein
MSWEQQMLILSELRQIRAQDSRLLRAGADSSGLCRGPKQKHPVNLQFSTEELFKS